MLAQEIKEMLLEDPVVRNEGSAKARTALHVAGARGDEAFQRHLALMLAKPTPKRRQKASKKVGDA